MSNMVLLEFDKLDSTLYEYPRWVTDVEIALTAQDIIATIRKFDSDLLEQPTAAKKAQALMLMRRHMDSSLQWEYMSIKDPRELWVALEARFDNIKLTLLQDLTSKWRDLRFIDFKTVAEYNSEALRLKSMLQFCGETLTEGNLIEKTLRTFPIAADELARQYQCAYYFKQITQFHQLINFMSAAEKHDDIFAKSYNSRHAGINEVYKANYNNKLKGGRKERKSRLREVCLVLIIALQMKEPAPTTMHQHGATKGNVGEGMEEPPSIEVMPPPPPPPPTSPRVVQNHKSVSAIERGVRVIVVVLLSIGLGIARQVRSEILDVNLFGRD